MFKCKECGLEYEIKPDYCECGNDEFEIIVSEKTMQTTEPEPIHIDKKTEPQISEPLNAYITTEEVSVQRSLSTGDILSIGFLILCIILSAIILWIPVKQDESTAQESESAITTVNNNIPPIDKFWNNSVAVSINKENSVPSQENKVQEIKIPAPIQKVVTTAKTLPKTQTTQGKSAISSNNTVKKTQAKPAQALKPAAQNKTQTTSSKPAQNTHTQKTQTTAAGNTTQQPPKPVQPAVTTSQQTQTSQSGPGITTVTLNKNPNISTVEQANNATALKQELSNYKAALRNTIGRKIDFTKVVGDGNCSVAFKIDNSGRLINRSFSKQSSNMTLNDAVYAAVMATPSYEVPPAAYKGENLTLNIRFFNGNFEISLY